jgi:uncharacterized surface protein with fasciclin (FAS1) repeats
MSMRCTSSLVVVLTGLSGCLPQPKQIDNSQLINGGVNLVPGPVLTAEKEQPSLAPIARPGPDLIDTLLESDQKHYDFTECLNASGLVPMLQTQGPYTIFAPTDAAFAKMPPGLLDEVLLPKNHAQLVRFVKYHILRGRLDFDDLLATNGQVQTMDGPPTSPAVGANSPARPIGSAVIIKGIDGKVMVNDVNVISTDTAANNGVIHWVDGVLIPPPLQDSHLTNAAGD